VSGELAPTGGGSIILAKDALPEQHGGDEDAPTRVDGSLVVTKGGSYVIGRKYAGSFLLSRPGFQQRKSYRSAADELGLPGFLAGAFVVTTAHQQVAAAACSLQQSLVCNFGCRRLGAGVAD